MSEEVQQPQSEILSAEQVQEVTTGEAVEQEEVALPSEEGEPDLIGGKFKSQDDLLKAYKELESKLGKSEEPTPEPTKEEPVDEEYVQWKQQKELDKMLEPVGGLAEYNKAVEWAKANMDEAEVTRYNEALKEAEGNPNITQTLVKSLIDKSKATATEPNGQPLHSTGPQRAKGETGYETKSDMMKDMADPRYEKDESYRQKVAQKLSMTDESKWYSNLRSY